MSCRSTDRKGWFHFCFHHIAVPKSFNQYWPNATTETIVLSSVIVVRKKWFMNVLDFGQLVVLLVSPNWWRLEAFVFIGRLSVSDVLLVESGLQKLELWTGPPTRFHLKLLMLRLKLWIISFGCTEFYSCSWGMIRNLLSCPNPDKGMFLCFPLDRRCLETLVTGFIPTPSAI